MQNTPTYAKASEGRQNLSEEEKFWGPKYGSIYPALEESEPYQKLLAQIEEFVDPIQGEKWVDLGTGSGALIDIIWNKSKGQISQLVALDLTDVMLEHLKRRLPFLKPEPREGQIKLIKHDLSKRLPFEDEEFDGVTASLVLTYIENHEGQKGIEALKALFSEVNRILKTHAQFVWTTPKYKVNFTKVFLASWKAILNPKKLKNLYYGPAILRYALKIQKKGKKGDYQFLPEEQFIKILENAGFENIKVEHSFAKQAIVFSSTKKQK
ncbi:class I SAM-dependent methyltransferase [Patescibacteria group bacterium]|nr:class I SAM-dependent methyltransferase [Patescibacteria group bacterium]